MFRNRKLLIATHHGKEKVIQPVLERSIGVQCYILEDLDTDRFGTFTGEIPREGSPVETLRKKCLYAMELTGADLAVASEGSFGPHPKVYMIPANEEFLILIDKVNQLEIIVRELSTSTNFSCQLVTSLEGLMQFASSVSFPTHALILKDDRAGAKDVVKGIQDERVLQNEFERMLKKHNQVYVETDMRAMNNPMRMEVIAAAAEKLVDRINQRCPACATPGFDVIKVVSGLPCAECSSPTKSALSYLYGCSKCGFEEDVLFPNKKEKEDAMYCDYCNP
jgi:hypothetical protein